MGTLYYLVGPSGSGKDTLLNYARACLATRDEPVLFAHRYITRPAAAGGENYIALLPAEFERRYQAGLFALAWDSHGYRYGIGIELNSWLERGFRVVMNGSRGYLDQALRHYPALRPVWLHVAPETLRQRLRQRGRETESAIAKRLSRAYQYPPPALPQLVMVDNNGPVEQGGDALVKILTLTVKD